jgi:hypothetical protein
MQHELQQKAYQMEPREDLRKKMTEPIGVIEIFAALATFTKRGFLSSSE